MAVAVLAKTSLKPVEACPLIEPNMGAPGLDFETWDSPIVIDKIARSQTDRWEAVKKCLTAFPFLLVW